jgi:hypothetical protein
MCPESMYAHSNMYTQYSHGKHTHVCRKLTAGAYTCTVQLLLQCFALDMLCPINPANKLCTRSFLVCLVCVICSY